MSAPMDNDEFEAVLEVLGRYGLGTTWIATALGTNERQAGRWRGHAHTIPVNIAAWLREFVAVLEQAPLPPKRPDRAKEAARLA